MVVFIIPSYILTNTISKAIAFDFIIAFFAAFINAIKVSIDEKR